jgi:hypothetical protein
MTLYSYCLRWDDGAAPNPFWGVCTLVICKPAIRRTARPGDWIVGLGGTGSPLGDLSCYVVYAMRVTTRMTMSDYDRYCRRRLPNKIPRWGSRTFERRIGDCVYDFAAGGEPSIRRSVHSEANRRVDLGGQNALLSDHFFYFGDHAIELPKALLPIIHPTQGHKSRANAAHGGAFVRWIEGLGLSANQLQGTPIHKHLIMTDPNAPVLCSANDLEADQEDAIC